MAGGGYVCRSTVVCDFFTPEPCFCSCSCSRYLIGDGEVEARRGCVFVRIEGLGFRSVASARSVEIMSEIQSGQFREWECRGGGGRFGAELGVREDIHPAIADC
jgi:hypothetical protein